MFEKSTICIINMMQGSLFLVALALSFAILSTLKSRFIGTLTWSTFRGSNHATWSGAQITIMVGSLLHRVVWLPCKRDLLMPQPYTWPEPLYEIKDVSEPSLWLTEGVTFNGVAHLLITRWFQPPTVDCWQATLVGYSNHSAIGWWFKSHTT